MTVLPEAKQSLIEIFLADLTYVLIAKLISVSLP